MVKLYTEEVMEGGGRKKWMDGGLKRTLRRCVGTVFYSGWIRLIRATDRFLGGWPIPLILLPATLVSFFRRREDYRMFKEMRGNLPPEVWGDLGPREHYFRMLYNWYSALSAGMCYGYMGERRWQRRVTVKGVPPDELPGSGDKPVVVTFLHTGGFVFLRHWLRARGIPAVSFGTLPRIGHFRDIIENHGDRVFGMEGLPHYLGHQELKSVIRFLRPRNALVMSMDGGRGMAPESVMVDGRAMLLQDGAVRFARKSGAILLPAWIRQTGLFSFELTYGTPVPEESIHQDSTRPAMECLATQFWSGLKRTPAEIGWSTLESLSAGKFPNRAAWP